MPKLLATVFLAGWTSACALSVPIPAPTFTVGPLGVSPIPPAPAVPVEVDPAYCGARGVELLPALSGAWSLRQGAGLVWGSTDVGSIMMPLPEQAPVGLLLESGTDPGVMHMRSTDLENEMFLFPTTEEQASVAEPLIGTEDPDLAAAGPECDWYDSPLFVGTNYYLGYDVVTSEDTGGWLPACNLVALVVSGFDPELCRTAADPSAVEFEMEMTLVLRFSGSDHASGMVYFEGTGQDMESLGGPPTEPGSEFRARAPVELTR